MFLLYRLVKGAPSRQTLLGNNLDPCKMRRGSAFSGDKTLCRPHCLLKGTLSGFQFPFSSSLGTLMKSTQCAFNYQLAMISAARMSLVLGLNTPTPPFPQGKQGSFRHTMRRAGHTLETHGGKSYIHMHGPVSLPLPRTP